MILLLKRADHGGPGFMPRLIAGYGLAMSTMILIIVLLSQHTFAASKNTNSTSNENPLQRWSHAAIVVGNDLYIHGGFQSTSIVYPELVEYLQYIDISKSFSLNSTMWRNMTFVSSRDSRPPLLASHTAVSDTSNKRIVVYGGQSNYVEKKTNITNAVYVFNTYTHVWTNPTKAPTPPQRFGHTAVRTKDKKHMIIFGGRLYDQNSTTYPFANDTWAMSLSVDSDSSVGSALKIIDDQNTSGSGPLIWNELPSADVKNISIRQYHTATLINSTHMAVLGGRISDAMVTMDSVLLYDIPGGKWSFIKAKGDIPSPRMLHTAVMLDNNKLLVHGGTTYYFQESMKDVAILDTASWSWESLEADPMSPSVFGHSATMIEPYILYTYGFSVGAESPNPSISIFDTNSMKFTDSYDAGRTVPGKEKQKSKPMGGGGIFGITVASVVGLLIALIFSFIGYTHYKKKSELDADKDMEHKQYSFQDPSNEPYDNAANSSTDSLALLGEHDTYLEDDMRLGAVGIDENTERQVHWPLNNTNLSLLSETSSNGNRLHLDNVNVPASLRMKASANFSTKRAKSKHKKNASSDAVALKGNRLTMPAPSQDIIKSLGLDQLDDDPGNDSIPLETITEVQDEAPRHHFRQESKSVQNHLALTLSTLDNSTAYQRPTRHERQDTSSTRQEIVTPDSLKEPSNNIDTYFPVNTASARRN
ncbi:hypothetical protein H4219_004273 [Mycoemilia scoparia]|uniref:Attractin/MKLN-like beta-propeller domain-containing protein n=1 Tax=Mycoemilia scoparia TaxID=417184 RepID=A0A9W7ZWP5_9FUNG|nr:hypothetical protein H4219_004273 [Mycoemilia scoparia]